MLQLVRPFVGTSTIAAITAAMVMAASAQTTTTKPDVHYVPTPEPVVERMLELAAPKPGELVIDLGSGDGRIAITAARKYGVRAIGIDIDPDRVAEAKANAKAAGVADKVEFRQENLFQTDIAEANVVTLYLLESLNLKLRPRLLAELKPGTRIVSHAFSMGDWTPDRKETVDGRQVYFWTVPDKRAQR